MNTTSTLTCPPGAQAHSMWSTSTTSCNVYTTTKMTMELLAIVSGLLTILAVLIVLPSSLNLYPNRQNNRRSSASSTTPAANRSIQTKARGYFLIHTLIHNGAQIAMFTMAIGSGGVIPPSVMGPLLFLIGYGVMAGTIHACSLWFFILPLRFLRQRPSMVVNIGRYLDNSVLLDALYFVLYLLATIPSLFFNDLRWTVRLISMLIFLATLLPLYLVPLSASTLHGIITNRAATDSCCVSMCALLRYKTSTLQDDGARKNSSSVGKHDAVSVSVKLRYSLMTILFLGQAALVGSVVLGLFDFAYEQPHIFYGALVLTGCVWEIFILRIFFVARVSSGRKTPSNSNKVGGVYKTEQQPSPTDASDDNTLELEIANVRRSSSANSK